MKKKTDIKNYLFLLVILISTMIFSILGFMGKKTIYADFSIDLFKTPQLAAVFEGMGQGKYPWSFDSYQTAKGVNIPEVSESANVQKKIKNDNTNKVKITKNTVNSKDAVRTDTEGNIVESKNDNTKNKKTLHFQKVNKDYFADALFIGDSRTVGLSEYSGWSKPTYYADVGLTIYDVLDKKLAKIKGDTVTIEKALKEQSFEKIYIMLGINELGRGNTKIFIKEYKKVIARIQKLQPNAIIYVEAIMNVSKRKSDSDPIFNNKNINDKNKHLAQLSDNKTIFYIDVNKAVTDKSGNLPQDYTFDSIHLKAAYYKIWTDFLLKHGIVKEELPAVK